VWETFSYDIFTLYADDRDQIEQDQKSDPNEYANLTSLIQRLESIEQARHGELAKPSKQDIKDYFKSEATVGVGTPIARRQRTKR
jgi:hypothetical protein